MEKRLEPPTINTKKELHNIYESVFKSSLPMTKKERILNSIFGYESWSWRVVGISKKALDVLTVVPETTVTIEDSTSGVSSSKQADIFTIAFPGDYLKQHDFSSADVCLENLNKITISS